VQLFSSSLLHCSMVVSPIRSKPLISLTPSECRESGQSFLRPSAARIWDFLKPVTHKVIPKLRGKSQKAL
jgi:hypothetical protein